MHLVTGSWIKGILFIFAHNRRLLKEKCSLPDTNNLQHYLISIWDNAPCHDKLNQRDPLHLRPQRETVGKKEIHITLAKKIQLSLVSTKRNNFHLSVLQDSTFGTTKYLTASRKLDSRWYNICGLSEVDLYEMRRAFNQIAFLRDYLTVKKIGSLWLHVPSDMKNGIIRNDYKIQQQRVTDTSYFGFCWPKCRVGDTSWHITRCQKRNVKGRTLHDILHVQQVLRTHTYAR